MIPTVISTTMIMTVRSDVLGSYPPELYRLLHKGTPGDVERYLQVLGDAESILELGCGYGRVAIALARQGHAVAALDIDAAFLRCAEAEARNAGVNVRWHLGDMRRFALERTFDAVIAPFNTMYCEKDLAGCFRAVYQHLRPGGRFLFDVYDVEDFHELVEDDEDIFETIAVIEAAGESIDIAERAIWDKAGQMLEVHYRHRWPLTDRPPADSSDETGDEQPGAHPTQTREQTFVITHHYRTRAQLRAALEEAGLLLKAIDPLVQPDEDGGLSLLFQAQRPL